MLRLVHRAGDVVKNQYRIEENIGSGGMGTVYKAVDTIIEARYACKEMDLLPDPGSFGCTREQLIGAFRKEASLAASLKHANIPRAAYVEEPANYSVCLECGKTVPAAGECAACGCSRLCRVSCRCYILFDYINGTNLEDIVLSKGRPFREEELGCWMVQVADALAYMHSRGVYHRDVKPDNIIVERGSQKAYLVDLGIASLSGGLGLEGNIALKQPEWGTKGYACARGRGAAGDAQRDIYALGMTLYRLLTCKDPKDGNDIRLLHSSSPRSLNPDMGEHMESIILRALSKGKVPYRSIEELSEDLRKLPGVVPRGGKEPLCHVDVSIKHNKCRLRIALPDLPFAVNTRVVKHEAALRGNAVLPDFHRINSGELANEVISSAKSGEPYDIVICRSGSGCMEKLADSNLLLEPEGYIKGRAGNSGSKGHTYGLELFCAPVGIFAREKADGCGACIQNPDGPFRHGLENTGEELHLLNPGRVLLDCFFAGCGGSASKDGGEEGRAPLNMRRLFEAVSKLHFNVADRNFFSDNDSGGLVLAFLDDFAGGGLCGRPELWEAYPLQPLFGNNSTALTWKDYIAVVRTGNTKEAMEFVRLIKDIDVLSLYNMGFLRKVSGIEKLFISGYQTRPMGREKYYPLFESAAAMLAKGLLDPGDAARYVEKRMNPAL